MSHQQVSTSTAASATDPDPSTAGAFLKEGYAAGWIEGEGEWLTIPGSAHRNHDVVHSTRAGAEAWAARLAARTEIPLVRSRPPGTWSTTTAASSTNTAATSSSTPPPSTSFAAPTGWS